MGLAQMHSLGTLTGHRGVSRGSNSVTFTNVDTSRHGMATSEREELPMPRSSFSYQERRTNKSYFRMFCDVTFKSKQTKKKLLATSGTKTRNKLG